MPQQRLWICIASFLLVSSVSGCRCDNAPAIDEDAGVGGGTGGDTGGGSGGSQAGGGTGGDVGGGTGGDTGGGTGGATGGGTGGATGGGTGGATGGGTGGATGGGTGGATGGGTGGATGGGTGGATGGGTGGSACSSDPGCTVANAKLCDPNGTNTLGTCVDVGSGCLKLQSLTACATTHQVCLAGASACSCATDPFCSVGAGTYCNVSKTSTVTCATDPASCVYQQAPSTCATPMTCAGDAGVAGCSCPALASAPVTGGGCSTPGAVACETGNTNYVLTCTTVGSCNVWQQKVSCGASSLVCGTKAGAAACECAPNTGTAFYADANAGSTAGAAPFPTGLQNPAQCRFKTLSSAMIPANAVATGAAGKASVVATGATGLTLETFGAETFPLHVQPNVTLTTTDTVPAPANYVIAFNDAAASSALVVHDLGTVTGFLVQQVSGNSTASGVTFSCNTSGKALVSASAVEAQPATLGTSLATGASVTGACVVALDTVGLRHAATAGLLVNSSSTSQTVTVTNGTWDGNAIGGLLTRGTVSLTGLNVKNSTAEGVLIQPASGDVVVTTSGGVYESNAREGLRVNAGTGATATSKLTMSTTEVKNNGTPPGSALTYPGLTITARSATFDTINVHNNAGGGLGITGTGAVTAATSHFDSNGSALSTAGGVGLGGAGNTATFTGTSCTLSSNRTWGLHVGGGAKATCHGCAINGNQGTTVGGLDLEGVGSTATLDLGSTVQRNVGNGIQGNPGTVLVLDGSGLPGTNLDVSLNGTGNVKASGANLLSTNTTVKSAAFHDNGLHGVRIDNGALTAGAPMAFTNASFTNNGTDGMLVLASLPATGGTNSLSVASSTFTGNQHGLVIAANAIGGNDVAASFDTNVFTGASDTGIQVGSSANSRFVFVGNTVTGNKPPAPAIGTNAGGIVLTGTPPAAMTFTKNLVHHNTLHQVAVVGLSTGQPPTWDLSGSKGASCDLTVANTIACYNNAPTAGTYVGIVTSGAAVLSQGNVWQNASPTVNVDYAAANGGSVTTAPPMPNCPASVIACP